MTPHDIDLWIAQQMVEITYNSEYQDYVLDKILYWKLENSFCQTIERDKKWFKNNLPAFKKMWDNILFFRGNKEKHDEFVEYIKNNEYLNNYDKIKDIIYNRNKTSEDIQNIKNYLNKLKLLKNNELNDLINKYTESISKYGKSSFPPPDFTHVVLHEINEVIMKKVYDLQK
jgi:hypothetical protein